MLNKHTRENKIIQSAGAAKVCLGLLANDQAQTHRRSLSRTRPSTSSHRLPAFDSSVQRFNGSTIQRFHGSPIPFMPWRSSHAQNQPMKKVQEIFAPDGKFPFLASYIVEGHQSLRWSR